MHVQAALLSKFRYAFINGAGIWLLVSVGPQMLEEFEAANFCFATHLAIIHFILTFKDLGLLH